MSRLPHNLIAFALLLLVSLTGVDSFALPTIVADLGGVQGLETSHQGAMERRRGLERQFDAREREFEVLADKIETLKRRKRRDAAQERALQGLLRSAQSVSASLSRLQGELRSVDETLSMISSQIVGGLDAEMRHVERGLSTASGAKRKQLVEQLNTLSKSRATYAAPLPRLDPGKLNSMLRLAEGVEDPDDMLAMAEELSDAEVNVRKKLGWVQGRLRELKRRRRLLARANSFSRQQRFFEEADRTQAVAQRVRSKSTNTVEVTSNKDDQGEAQAPGLEEPAPAPDAAPADPAPTPPADNATGGFEADSASDPTTAAPEAPARYQSPPTSDSDTGGQDPFGSEDVIVQTSRPDPSAPARGAYFDDADLDARIKRLEKDKDELRRQARTLKKRVTRLRKGAQAVD